MYRNLYPTGFPLFPS